jgi:hypothetical protein
MKLGKWGATALLLSVVFCLSQNALQAQNGDESGQYRSAYDAAQAAGDSLTKYASYSEDDGSYSEDGSYLVDGSCASGSCNSGCDCNDCQGSGLSMGSLSKDFKGLCRRPGQFFLGATYYYARPNFSEALAYIESQNPSLNPFTPGQTTFHMFDFDYNSSYGLDGGYRLCDCGGEIRFSFLRLNSGAEFSAAPEQAGDRIFSPYEIDGNIQGRASTDLKSYDLGFSKTIPLGSPLGCCNTGCCDSVDCGDGCGCGWCPAWDLTWSVGLRYIETDWSRGTQAFDDDGIFIDAAGVQMDFHGAGPRVGVLGRRYFGCNGWFSLFAEGNIALLLGNTDLNIQTFGQGDPVSPDAITRAKALNVIPATDIEVGGTIHIRNRFNLSAGYFFAAFHDLGMRDEYDFNQFQVSHLDDANILSFDGFFARAELTF